MRGSGSKNGLFGAFLEGGSDDLRLEIATSFRFLVMLETPTRHRL